ncbi:MAG: tetratricopeptide repeat protein [Bacteroidetes bacterium]|nr:tetratricopeptide repeat protein [Bacteroidota bacterium]MCY4233514.1 tetratricopeptide repeat protein [Bacteroidota bacterium]
MIRVIFVYFVLAGALTCTVYGQPQNANRTAPPEEEQILNGDSGPRYQLALSYLRGMQFDRAISILSELRDEFPQHNIFFEMLKEAYINSKRYDDAIALLNDEIPQSNPEQQTVLSAERAQLFFLNGNEPEAMNLWYALVNTSSRTEDTYRIVYSSMIRVRLLVQAIDLLLQGREIIGNPNLFQADIAYLYSLTGQHELATQEYLDILALSDQQLNYVKGRLGRDLEQNGALDAAIKITKERIRAQPNTLQFRHLLAWLYEEKRQFDLAFQEILFLEEHSNDSGQLTYQFALRAAEIGAFEVAGQAYQTVLETHPNESIFSDARLGLADMYRLLAERTSQNRDHYQKALDAYINFLSDFPNHSHSPQVLSQIASLHQNIFRNRDAARAILIQLNETYPHSEIGYQAQYNLGQLSVDEDDLVSAYTIFSELSNLSDGELSAHARFEQALIKFYLGQFEESQFLLSTIKDDTDKETANDAITLRVLLLDHPPLDSTNLALINYAKAKLLMRQNRLSETIDLTDQILTTWGQNPIADDTRFLRAQALLLDGQSDKAMLAFGELPLIHPQSPLRDRSLFYYAETLENHGKSSEALKAYNDLLIQYPGSLFVSQARERIRLLRAESI